MLKKVLYGITTVISEIGALSQKMEDLLANSNRQLLIAIPEEKLLTQKEAAWACKKHIRTIRRDVKSGKLPQVGKRGAPRYRQSDLDKLK